MPALSSSRLNIPVHQTATLNITSFLIEHVLLLRSTSTCAVPTAHNARGTIDAWGGGYGGVGVARAAPTGPIMWPEQLLATCCGLTLLGQPRRVVAAPAPAATGSACLLRAALRCEEGGAVCGGVVRRHALQRDHVVCVAKHAWHSTAQQQGRTADRDEALTVHTIS